jgi:hypothetical protein
MIGYGWSLYQTIGACIGLIEAYAGLVGAYARSVEAYVGSVGAYVLSRVRGPIFGYIVLVRALFFLSLVLPLCM